MSTQNSSLVAISPPLNCPCIQNPAIQHHLVSRPLLTSECAPARIVSQKMHFMLGFQRLAHKTCNESCSSRLPVAPQTGQAFE
jgi:hypothetical protein